MKDADHFAKRFREVILNGTWIANTNYKDQLSGLSWNIAVTRIGPLNTISLLAQHVLYYIKGIRNVLEGGTLDISDRYSFEFEPINSQTQWDKILQEFWTEAEKFASLIEIMPNQQLAEVFVEEKYSSYERNIEAMIEHSYYHLGQIVLIRKIIENS